MQHFREDLYASSERNRLKVSSHYVVLEGARGRHRELGISTVIGNIPSRYLEDGRQEEAVDAIIAATREHTGFNLVGPNTLTALNEARWAVEATYILKHSVTNFERTFTGSWRNTWGRLTDFAALVHRDQILAQVDRLAVPGAVETELGDIFAELDSEWEYNGLVSLVLNFQLRGHFPAQFRGTRTSLLD